MRKDDYNDAIKRKLQSIEPEFQESDWEDLKALMAVPKTTYHLSKFYKPLGYGLTGIAFLTSLLFNARHYYQDNDQAEKSILEKKLDNKTFEKNTTPEIVYKTDTVFVDRIITKIEKLYINEPSDSGIDQSSDEKLLNKDLLQSKREEIVKSNVIASSELDDIIGQNENDGKASEKLGNQKLDEEAVILTEAQVNSQTDLSLIQASTKIERSPSSPFLQYLNQPLLPTLKLDLPYSYPHIIEGVKTPELANHKSHIVIRIPRLNFSNFRYRYGLNLDVANEQLAGGFTNELILSKNFGISAGFRLSNLKGNDYHTDGEYLMQTGLDFRAIYGSFVHPEKDIVDIIFDNYFLQIPLNLSYRFPLRNQWTILLLLGTDLDIAGREYVKFEYQNDEGVFEEGINKANISNPIFNNGLISAGIEKKIGKYVFQLLPYASAQWKTSIYKRDDILAGINLKMMFQPKWDSF
ncbi:MAG: hypothetical protein NXI00_16180 [Cytophagales bacterium]|nr:hypothetical protein [Cytophagales bacterium]